MSLSSRFKSILSWPERPNARAISRFPAGWSDEAMKSRSCLRLGRPAERLRGIVRLMIVIPDLIRDPPFLHSIALKEGRPRLKAGVTRDQRSWLSLLPRRLMVEW